MKNIKKIHTIWLLLFGLILNFALTQNALAIPAFYQRCEPSTNCIIGEYVFANDGYTPITTDTFCQITITDPNDVVIANGVNMSDKNDGWYYYTANIASPEGLYRSIICCDTGANKRCIDKTFILGTSFESLPAKVWTYTTRTLSSFGTLVSDIWSNSSRTLTAFGSLAADVWNDTFAPTRRLTDKTLTGGGSLATESYINTATSTIIAEINENQTKIAEIRDSQQKQWKVYLSDIGQVLAGSTYRAKLWVLNYESAPTDSFATPTVTIYDASRNTVVSGVAMTKLSTGVYEYTYNVAGTAGAGIWETEVSTEVESGKTIKVNDYWEVEASPAEVKINSITDNTVPSIVANVTITNEGTADYEYQYEYCIVDSLENKCGGGDDINYAVGAKLIAAGQKWTTDLTLTANNIGTYYYKLAVYWGTERSVAVKQFNAIAEAVTPPPPTGGGGGGGGAATPPPVVVYKGADFNLDGIVNSTDFSILLYFWKTKPPFKNARVDINQDGKVDSVDFSILLYQWGKPGVNIK